MRILSFVIASLVVGAPAAACDFDSYPGYSHSAGAYDDQASIDAARAQAMVDARNTFIRQYGLGDAPGATPVSAPASADAGIASPPASPPSDNLTR